MKTVDINDTIIKAIIIKYSSNLPSSLSKTEKELILNLIIKNSLEAYKNSKDNFMTFFRRYFINFLQVYEPIEEEVNFTKKEQQILNLYYNDLFGSYFTPLQVSSILGVSFSDCNKLIKQIPNLTKTNENGEQFNYLESKKIGLGSKVIARCENKEISCLSDIKEEVSKRCLLLNNETLYTYYSIIKFYINGAKNYKEISERLNININIINRVLTLTLKGEERRILNNYFDFDLNKENLDNKNLESLIKKYGDEILKRYLKLGQNIRQIATTKNISNKKAGQIIEILNQKQLNNLEYKEKLEEKYLIDLKNRNLEDIFRKKAENNYYFDVLACYLKRISKDDIASLLKLTKPDVTKILKSIEKNMQKSTYAKILEKQFHVEFYQKTLDEVLNNFPNMAFSYENLIRYYILNNINLYDFFLENPNVNLNEFIIGLKEWDRSYKNDLVFKKYADKLLKKEKSKEKIKTSLS